jgi:hypothetical protein
MSLSLLEIQGGNRVNSRLNVGLRNEAAHGIVLAAHIDASY